uniref:Uncharacterized protein n=1 Tax=viral metagenome TaxID=1070528 RepID=A0A6M3MD03_9ZZZZ
MNSQDLRAVARSLAYGMLECEAFISQLTTTNGGPMNHIVDSMFRNQASEFWHCLNRKFYVEGDSRGLRIVDVVIVDRGIANTLAWLKWYQRGGHKQNDETPDEERIPMPEWEKEYI